MELDIRTPAGNVFEIMGLVRQLLQAQRADSERVAAVMADMSSGDYWHALAVANRETFDSFRVTGLNPGEQELLDAATSRARALAEAGS